MDPGHNRTINISSLKNVNGYSKWIFWILVILSFILLPVLSLDAGISGDEHLHYQHSLKVLKYISSLGADKSALDTPGTHLKYYGQLFDNLVSLFAGTLKIKDIYTFRHVANALAGWLIILLSGFLARSLFGYRTAIVVVLLFLISPRFIGHAFNNLKDIPFALGYVASLFFSFEFIRQWPTPKRKTMVFLTLAFAFILGVRIGGVMVYGYLVFFGVAYVLWQYLKGTPLDRAQLIRISAITGCIFIISWFLGLLFWPYGLEHPIANPYRAFLAMSHFPTAIRQIFEGQVIWSDVMPWYYLPKFMALTIPMIVFPGMILYLIRIRFRNPSLPDLFSKFLLFTILFPPLFIILNNSNTYGGWRHILFVYPPVLILSARGWVMGWDMIKTKWIQLMVLAIISLGFIGPMRFMICNHPYEYLYFNELAGGLEGAYGRYETDYYYHGMRKGSEWLKYHEIVPHEGNDTIVVASNFPVQWWFRDVDRSLRNVPIHYYTRGQAEWDYAIIGNSYIQPYHLKNNRFPPLNTIYSVTADSVPICVVVERQYDFDYLAYEALKDHDYRKAVGYSKLAISHDPNCVSNYLTLARSYNALHVYDSAIISLHEALVCYPDYELAYDLLGQIYVEQDQPDQSEIFYRKALDMNFKYFPAYIHLADILMAQGKDKEGVALLKKCLTLNPEYQSAYEALGLYFSSIGEEEIGKKYLEHSKSLK